MDGYSTPNFSGLTPPEPPSPSEATDDEDLAVGATAAEIPSATSEFAQQQQQKSGFDLNVQHGHKDLVEAVAFNSYGDRFATGSVDGKIRVFNRHKDGVWRLCDTWGAHGGEILQIHWLPSTIYPNLIASLGIEGQFKFWSEDPTAPPGRRFSPGSYRSSSTPQPPAFETRSPRGPYRSFSMKHTYDSRQTYLALLASDGRLTVYESDQPENLAVCSAIDEFQVCERPARGEEVSFRVQFDPNPDPCYHALRAGVNHGSVGLVVAAMNTVRVYRSRDVDGTPFGLAAKKKEFYLAVEIPGHRGLVRDVAWAPGNIRGYDMIATACQDGYVRVFRVDAPWSKNDGKTWSSSDLRRTPHPSSPSTSLVSNTTTSNGHTDTPTTNPAQQSSLTAGLSRPTPQNDRHAWSQPGQIRHTADELSRADAHRTPVWRVGFDDDGRVLTSVGDDGKLVCYRQMSSGAWGRSSEMSVLRERMVKPVLR